MRNCGTRPCLSSQRRIIKMNLSMGRGIFLRISIASLEASPPPFLTVVICLYRSSRRVSMVVLSFA